MPETPEQKARRTINRQLAAARWLVQDIYLAEEDPLDKVWYSEEEPQERAQCLSDGPKPQADISCWKIAPGDDAWQWSECRDQDFIAVGWDEIGDLSSVTRAEFEARRDALIKKHPDWKKRGLEQLWKFIGIQQGDLFLRGPSADVGAASPTRGWCAA